MKENKNIIDKQIQNINIILGSIPLKTSDGQFEKAEKIFFKACSKIAKLENDFPNNKEVIKLCNTAKNIYYQIKELKSLHAFKHDVELAAKKSEEKV